MAKTEEMNVDWLDTALRYDYNSLAELERCGYPLYKIPDTAQDAPLDILRCMLFVGTNRVTSKEQAGNYLGDLMMTNGELFQIARDKIYQAWNRDLPKLIAKTTIVTEPESSSQEQNKIEK